MKSYDPPKWAERFFRWICEQKQLEGLEGDLYELYERRVTTHGHRVANWFYLFDMLSLMRGSVIKLNAFNKNSNTMDMLIHHLKMAFRSGLKRKSFALINLLGITLGITAVLFISIYLWNETHYDQHYAQVDNKYRVFDIMVRESGKVSTIPMVPPPIGPALKSNFSQVVKAGRLYVDYGGTVFRVGDKVFSEENGFYAEFDALEILDVNIIDGSIEALNEPLSFLFSKSLFTKFFGDVPYDNQTVQLGTYTFSVGGVFEDFPEQSHIRPDYLISFDLLVNQTPEKRMKSWLWHQFITYVELEEGTDLEAFTTEIQSFVKEKSAKDLASIGITYSTHFQPMKRIHLHSSEFKSDVADRNSYQNVLFLGVAAIIILLIACLNFINLTSAQIISRAKEVGIRKFVGAQKRQIFLQHSIESLLYVSMAGMISLALFVILLPAFNQFTEKNFELSVLFSPSRLLVYVSALIILGTLAGAHPATVLTKIKAIRIVRGLKTYRVKWGRHTAYFDPRQLLVGLQYILSIGLILISAVVHKQYTYMQEANLGFNKENLILVQTVGAMNRDLANTRSSFSTYSNVKNVSFSYGVPGGIVAGDGIIIPRLGNKEQSTNVFVTDHNFIRTLELEIIAGRDFNVENSSDHAQGFILNEAALRTFDLGSPEEALGESIHWNHWNYPDSVKKGRVIGVVKDFNMKSMRSEVQPVAIHLLDSYMTNMIIRIGAGDLKQTIEFLETQYETFAPGRPFEFTFLDQNFNDFYLKEQKMAQIFSLFTGLSVLTALIGLLGLVSYSINSRGKELSIRKVLGAGIINMYQLLVKKYLVLAGISLFIGTPIAYYIVIQWLDDFAYRINVGFWMVAQVAIVIIVLTVLIVSWHTIKGIRANPVDKLRTD